MYTVLGLGNPGEEYEGTRHNVGRTIARKLCDQGNGTPFKSDSKSKSLVSSIEIFGKKVRIVLPETFMNRSGQSAAYFIKGPKDAKNLIVIHDDIDLPLGVIRLSFARGSGGHKGVESIARSLKTKDFIRLRVGVSKVLRGEAVKPKGEEEVQKFVLGNFDKRSQEKLIEVEERALDALKTVISLGLEKAMGEYNKK